MNSRCRYELLLIEIYLKQKDINELDLLVEELLVKEF